MRHRGPAPEDVVFFDEKRLSRLRSAVRDLSWLLGRGYSARAASELVGNRYQLTSRERLALSNAAKPAAPKRKRRMDISEITDRILYIDGFNVLITLESALGGGILVRGSDGCLRDMASVHSSYHMVSETRRAIALVMRIVKAAAPVRVVWLFDRPVSNSGRIAALVQSYTERIDPVYMEARAIERVDTLLKKCDGVVATADSEILDSGVEWLDMVSMIVEESIPEAKIIDLSDKGEDNRL